MTEAMPFPKTDIVLSYESAAETGAFSLGEYLLHAGGSGGPAGGHRTYLRRSARVATLDSTRFLFSG